VLFGESLGGSVAAWLAARQQPAALVIASGFTSVPDLGTTTLPISSGALARTHPLRLRAKNLRTVTAPVLIAHSPEDESFRSDTGARYSDAANQPKRFLELAGGHNDGFIFMT